MTRIVMKFGGTSVANAASIGQTASIILSSLRNGTAVVAVVSAMSGVTDALTRGILCAAAGDRDEARTVVQDVVARTSAAAHELLPAAAAGEQTAAAERVMQSYLAICESAHTLGEATARTLDMAISSGEPIVADLLTATLRARGGKAVSLDPGEMIVTDNQFGNAAPLLDRTRTRCLHRVAQLTDPTVVPVIGGFIGATKDGARTTLGRGGSDFTAAILGHALSADEVWIWTDVDGVMTADPRLVPEARVIPDLSYAEVGELAYFGAKVLHPRTIRPLVDEGIPLRIKNTFRPDQPGTLIRSTTDPAPGAVKAVTTIHGLAMITVEGRGMLGVPGIAAHTFDAVARCRANVLMISQASSEQSICFVVPTADVECVRRELEREFELQLSRREIDRIGAQQDIAIVTAMGAGIRGVVGVAGRLFSALSNASINIIAIAQGSSECSISLVVDAADQAAAVAAIHKEAIT